MRFSEEVNIIQDSLGQADRLLEQAETSTSKDQVLPLCRKAIRELLLSFLTFKRLPPKEGEAQDLNNLLAQCLAVEEEFVALVEVIAFFARLDHLLNEDELEMVIDAANEVWDFILSYLPDNAL